MVQVSVVIPMYNSARHLRRCLRSLKKQNLDAAEFICVDDGSSDRTGKICQRYSSKDQRFKYILKEHAGVSAARNKGLAEAKGKYILFLDSDDTIEAGALTDLYNMAEENCCDAVKFSANVVNGDPWQIEKFRIKHDEMIGNFTEEMIFSYKECTPFVWPYLFKRSVLADNGIEFDTELFIGEDHVFVILALQKCRRVLFTSGKYYTYYNRRNNTYNTKKVKKTVKCQQHIALVKKVFEHVGCRDKNVCLWAYDLLVWAYLDSGRFESDKIVIKEFVESNQILDIIEDAGKERIFNENF